MSKKPNNYLPDYAYEKYIKPVRDRELKAKRDRCRRWLDVNWINLVAMVASVIAAVASIVQLLK